MKAREVARVLWKSSPWKFIKYFFPVYLHNGQVMIMRPYWHNGHFGMKSINKVKGARK